MTAPFGGYNSEPTTPGPFSFLQGIGEVYAAHKQYQQEAQARAVETANRILQLRQLGYVKPEDFAKPEVQNIFKHAGMPIPSANPTTGELISKAQGDAVAAPDASPTPGINIPLPAFGTALAVPSAPISVQPTPGGMSLAKARLTGLPSAADIAADRLKAAQAGAEMPNVPLTATAGAQGAQDPAMAAVAGRVVNDLFVKNGRIPTVAEAMVQGSGDIRAKQYGGQLNESFYGDAIQQLRDAQTKLQIAREGVAGRTAAGAADDTKKQQDALNAQINDLRTQKAAIHKTLSPVAVALLGVPGTTRDKLSTSDQAILAQEDALQQQLDSKQNDLNSLNAVGGTRVAQRNAGAPQSATLLTRADWDNKSDQARQHLDNPQLAPHFKQIVTQGRANHLTDKQIADQITAQQWGGRP